MLSFITQKGRTSCQANITENRRDSTKELLGEQQEIKYNNLTVNKTHTKK